MVGAPLVSQHSRSQALVKKEGCCRQKMLGSPPRVSHDGRFVSGDACNQEPDGDTRHRDSDLDRFGPSDRRNTLRPVSLMYCIEM